MSEFDSRVGWAAVAISVWLGFGVSFACNTGYFIGVHRFVWPRLQADWPLLPTGVLHIHLQAPSNDKRITRYEFLSESAGQNNSQLALLTVSGQGQVVRPDSAQFWLRGVALDPQGCVLYAGESLQAAAVLPTEKTLVLRRLEVPICVLAIDAVYLSPQGGPAGAPL